MQGFAHTENIDFMLGNLDKWDIAKCGERGYGKERISWSKPACYGNDSEDECRV